MVRNTLGKGFLMCALPYPFTSLFQKRFIGYINNIKAALEMNNKFTQWSQLIMCDKIKPNEKVVLMVILNCNNMGWSYIAHSEIMRQSGLSESTTKRVLTKLKKNGLINEVKSEVNNMNNYIVSGFNLNGLMENETHENSQVGSNLTASGFNLTYKKKINKNKGNNNNYNNSTSRYMVSVNENSKKYVKTEVVSIPTNDSLTDGTLNFVCSRDGLIEDAIGSIPTAQDTTPMKTLREADEWEYRQSKDGCWKQTMDKELTRLGKTPTEDDMRKLCNSIYKDWETRNEAKNKRTLDEMVQYAFTRYGIALQPKKKKQSNFGKPTHNTNRPTTTEINNMSFVNLSKNVDVLERLELASKDSMVFIDAMNKCIEYLQITRNPTISVCKVWFNALNVIKTNGDKMSDNRLNYACDTMDALEKAIHDCGGQGIMKTLQNDEYSHLFKVA